MVLKSGASIGYSEREDKAIEPKGREAEARGDVGVGGRNKRAQEAEGGGRI